jgi:hypothetical protein
MKPLILLSAACALFFGCGDGKADAADKLAQLADSVPANVLDLASHGLPLQLEMPDKQLLGGMEPTVVLNENTGKLEVRAGEHFALTIVEEPGDMVRVKADLDREQIRQNSTVRETPELLVYKSEFPDDPTLVFLHFYQVVKVGDRGFVVEDIQDGTRFNEQDIERMAAAVRAPSPA